MRFLILFIPACGNMFMMSLSTHTRMSKLDFIFGFLSLRVGIRAKSANSTPRKQILGLILCVHQLVRENCLLTQTRVRGFSASD
jgi:hypothetical protein